LCLEDIFNKGLPVYFFENLCRQKRDLPLNDRTYKVFFNAHDCDKLKSKEERDFFNFLKGERAESQFAKTIEEKVERAKKNEKWRKIYMTWQQTIDEEKEIAREEGREAGREEGIRLAAIENAKNLLKLGIAIETISKGCSLPIEEVQKLADELKVEN
jgi:predicted transposase/invertase (TIGR01784 family)